LPLEEEWEIFAEACFNRPEFQVMLRAKKSEKSAALRPSFGS
jgi:hypothetical protein